MKEYIEAISYINQYNPSLEYVKSLDHIKKLIKVLEVVKRCKVVVGILIESSSLDEYNYYLFDVYTGYTHDEIRKYLFLDQEEYDLLKEVFGNE